MALILPDNRLEYPGLLVPGRKPTVPVRIDRQHPLAPDELCALLGARSVELVHGDALSTSSGSITPVIDGRSESLKFDGNTHAYIVLPHPVNHHVSGDRWAVTWKGRNNPGNSADTVFCGEALTGTNYIQMRGTSEFRVAAGATYSLSGLGTNIWDDSGWNTVVFYGDGYLLYKKGYLIGYKPASADASAVPIEVIGDAYNNTAYAFDGYLEALYCHSWALDPSQILALHNNPYQFLVPA